MAYCGPSCAVPSCASTPTVGLGPAGCGGLGYRGLGYGLGYGALGYGALGYGAGALTETSASLGTLRGIVPSCVNQIPASEVVIQPPPSVVTIPGPILSASCEPVSVGGNTPCAAPGAGIYGGGIGTGLYGPGFLGDGICGGWGYGQRRRGLLRRKSLPGRRGSICW